MNSKFYILYFFVISLSSCYYDSEETLYPKPPACDTMDVSYVNDIDPLLKTRCYSCHGNNNTVSAYEFEGYADLMLVLSSRNLLGAIKRIPGVTAMPQGAEKLPDCEINIIEAWINQGKRNN